MQYYVGDRGLDSLGRALSNSDLRSSYRARPQLVELRTSGPSHPAAGYMGSWFSDRLGINIDAAAGLQQLLNNIANVIHNLGSAIANINWQVVGANLQLVVHGYFNILNEMNPIHRAVELFKTTPIFQHSFTELNNFLGGGITTLDNIGTLPARVGRGDAISKQELITDGLFALKVAIIALSGGTAASIISGTSGQLSQGTLGKTSLGKGILTGAGAAAGDLVNSTDLVDVTAGDIASSAAYGTAVVGLQAGQAEVVKSTPLGQTEAGQIAIGAGFAAGGSQIIGDQTATEALSSYGRGAAISEAGKATPGGSLIAKTVFDQSGNIISGGDSSSSDSGGGFQFPDLASIPGKIADAISNISIGAPSFDISSPEMPSVSVGGAQLSLPEVNVGQIMDIFFGGQKRKVASRRKKTVGGKTTWLYTLDDGTVLEEADYSWLAWLLGAVVVGVAVA